MVQGQTRSMLAASRLAELAEVNRGICLAMLGSGSSAAAAELVSTRDTATLQNSAFDSQLDSAIGRVSLVQ